jgi:hypothetical protein
VGVGLAHAPEAPLHGLLDEPPVERLAVDRPATGRLVGGDQLVERAEPGHLQRGAEPPRLHADPRQVLERVTQVDELPVDGGREPLGTDDHVAEAQVAVDDHGRRALGPVGDQPVVGLLEGGAHVLHGLVALPVLGEGVELPHAGHLGRVDGVEPGQEPPDVADERAAGGGVLVVAQDPAGQRLARHAGHDEPRRAEAAAVVVG